MGVVGFRLNYRLKQKLEMVMTVKSEEGGTDKSASSFVLERRKGRTHNFLFAYVTITS